MKNIKDLSFKIPLKISIKTIIEMGALNAAIDSGLLEDGYWTNHNEEERSKYIKEINNSVTKHILDELKKYGVDLNQEL